MTSGAPLFENIFQVEFDLVIPEKLQILVSKAFASMVILLSLHLSHSRALSLRLYTLGYNKNRTSGAKVCKALNQQTTTLDGQPQTG